MFDAVSNLIKTEAAFGSLDSKTQREPIAQKDRFGKNQTRYAGF